MRRNLEWGRSGSPRQDSLAPQHVVPVGQVGRVHPLLLEQAEGTEHAWEHAGLGAGLAGAVNCDLKREMKKKEGL